MMALIGIKRLIIIGILLGFNAVLGAGVYLYLVPENEKMSKQLSSLTSKINTTRNDTTELETNYKLIQEEKFDYENLLKAGFFDSQDRLAFRRRMSEVQRYSKVLRASFDITPANVEENKGAEDADHVILRSVVSVNIDAMDDIDLYNFIFWLENGFPGHSTITKLSMKRELDVDENSLRQIGSGRELVLVSGSLDYEWRTMVPKNDVGENFQSFGNDF